MWINERDAMTMPTEQHIKARAHELWENAGRPEGDAEKFWYEAERELNGQAVPNSSDGADNPDEKSKTFTE